MRMPRSRDYFCGCRVELAQMYNIIPSKINCGLNILSLHPENNKVYHQKVALITFTEKGWYMECDKDREYATDRILSEKMYKETWFLSQEEAEAKLKEMEKKDV